MPTSDERLSDEAIDNTISYASAVEDAAESGAAVGMGFDFSSSALLSMATELKERRAAEGHDCPECGCSTLSDAERERRRVAADDKRRAADLSAEARVKELEVALSSLRDAADLLLAEVEGQGGTYGATRDDLRAQIAACRAVLDGGKP